jgi:predicted Zn-dependent protease
MHFIADNVFKRVMTTHPINSERPLDRRQALRITATSLFVAPFCGCLVCGCRTAPITGRKQLLLMPESEELTLGVQAFQETLSAEPLSQHPQNSAIVERVGKRIAAVSGRNDYQWEFKLIASPTENAFCLPGGKVAIYEGILPICQNEAGLAVVMSHEVAHALARHGGERMSQDYAVQGAQKMVSSITKKRIPERHELLMQAYGLGTQYGVLLPYSRKQESEADHIGVMLMAQAGYDPQEAPRFWQRFSQINAGAKQPEFLSTHPSDSRRATDLMNLLGEASGYYTASTNKYGLGEYFSA